jgi:hypothetical protein
LHQCIGREFLGQQYYHVIEWLCCFVKWLGLFHKSIHKQQQQAKKLALSFALRLDGVPSQLAMNVRHSRCPRRVRDQGEFLDTTQTL